jgi:iron complex outermembrane receptor protein
MPAWAGRLGVTDNNFQFKIPVGAGLPTFTPSVNFTDPAIIKLTDVGGWGKDATMHHPIVEDTLGAAQAVGQARAGRHSFARRGRPEYSKREKSHEDIRNYYFLKNDRAPAAVSAGPDPADHLAGLRPAFPVC